MKKPKTKPKTKSKPKPRKQPAKKARARVVKRPAPSTRSPRSSSDSRAFVRVDFDSGAKIGISFADQAGAAPTHVAYDALDLSVYGISFLAPPSEVDRFTVGQKLEPIAFVIDGQQVTATGKVVYVRTGLAGGLAKVAVELTTIATEDVWCLSRHVAQKAGLGVPMQLAAVSVRRKAR